MTDLPALHAVLDAEFKAIAASVQHTDADALLDWLDELERLDRDMADEERADDAAA